MCISVSLYENKRLSAYEILILTLHLSTVNKQVILKVQSLPGIFLLHCCGNGYDGTIIIIILIIIIIICYMLSVESNIYFFP